MTLEQVRDELVQALQRAIGEHGTPNTFGLMELQAEYGGPSPRQAGRICRRFLTSLAGALGVSPTAIEYNPKAKGYKSAAITISEV